MSESDLARFQAAMLTLLARTDIDDAERTRRLREDEAFAPFADYVASIEPRFLATCVDVMRKWHRPDQD